MLRVARSSARKGRAQALNQIRSLISTGPEVIRADLRDRSIYEILERCSAYRVGGET